MKTDRMRSLFAVLAFALTGVIVAPCRGDDASTGSGVSTNLRDVRYCEVIPVTLRGDTLVSEVYNTLGLNDCPAAEWDALTEEEVKAAYGSLAAKLNGPRHWVMDELVVSASSVPPKTFTFGGIEMARRGILETKIGEGTVGDEFYVPNEVQRDTIYTYDAGKSVFELTSPEGDVYIMQSYALIADETLTIDDLPALGERLQLPAGWTYSTRTLAQDFHLESSGLAYIINDDLYNTYQRWNQRPVCTGAVANLLMVWPPNHKWVLVSISGVTDPDGDPVTIAATGVFQDEAVKGSGSGNTSPDATLSPLAVRAERNGTGNGRVYRIEFTGDDGQGSTCTGAVRVCIPNAQRPGSSCGDEGPLFDSLWESLSS